MITFFQAGIALFVTGFLLLLAISAAYKNFTANAAATFCAILFIAFGIMSIITSVCIALWKHMP